MPSLSRRSLLAAATAGIPLLSIPRIAFARALTEQRFILIILRGAMDGLAVIPPLGDPAYADLRGPLAQPGAATIDGLFGFHPALAEVAGLFAAGDALAVHAVASPYRDRSHFDGQNVLETGGTAPYALKDGWLNRLLTLLPGSERAIAIMPGVPPVLRGPVAVESYAPSRLPGADDELLDRVAMLYANDSLLHPLWDKAMAARTAAAAMEADGGNRLPGLAKLAAGFLSAPDGPRIAVLESDGWDTHSAQQARLNGKLQELDAAFATLKAGLGAAWATTMVLAATEFGRTARMNGTGGTDHGTGAAALLAGGAVRGGRVLADWPGLATEKLYQGRDLRPTTDLRTLILASAQHLGIDPDRAAPHLFAQAPHLRPAPVLS